MASRVYGRVVVCVMILVIGIVPVVFTVRLLSRVVLVVESVAATKILIAGVAGRDDDDVVARGEREGVSEACTAIVVHVIQDDWWYRRTAVAKNRELAVEESTNWQYWPIHCSNEQYYYLS